MQMMMPPVPLVAVGSATATAALPPPPAHHVPTKDAGGGGGVGGFLLSGVEADFIRSTLLMSTSPTTSSPSPRPSPSRLRADGRRRDELRPCRLSLSRTSSSGGGGASADVRWGPGTRVLAAVEGELAPPPADRPSEGAVAVSVDLSCGASPQFRHAAPLTAASSGGGDRGGANASSPSLSATEGDQKRLSNRILRCLERLLVSGGGGSSALDVEALCVVPGEWAWKLKVSVTILDAAGGNLMDAAVLACSAALRHYRRPHVQLNNTSSGIPTLIPPDFKEPDPLPLHHTPLSLSFGLVVVEGNGTNGSSSNSHDASALQQRQQQQRRHNAVEALVDPTDREEMVSSGYLTLAGNAHGEVLLMDYAGGSSSGSSGSGSGSLSGGGAVSGSSTSTNPYASSRACCELTLDRLKRCHRVAFRLLPALCMQLEDSLQEADAQWRRERLLRLQQLQQRQDPRGVAAAGRILTEGTGDDFDQDEDMAVVRVRQREDDAEESMAQDDGAAAGAAIAASAEWLADEAYRRQALDYNAGHFAIRIKEGSKDNEKDREASAASAAKTAASGLLSFLLESAKAADKKTAAATTTTTTATTEADVVAAVPATPVDPDGTRPSRGQAAREQPPANDSGAAGKSDDDPYAMSDDEQEGEQEDDRGPSSSRKLTSEFARSGGALPARTAPPPPSTATSAGSGNGKGNEDDDDVDDLAAAIKVKSKKKQSKKKR